MDPNVTHVIKAIWENPVCPTVGIIACVIFIAWQFIKGRDD